KGKEKLVLDVFDKWDLPCSQIGEVTTDGKLQFFMNGELEAEVPAYELVLGGGAPVYDRPFSEPKYMAKIKAFNPDTIKVPTDLKATAEDLIQLPSIASKRWIYVQYDSMVGAGTTGTNQPSDAAVVLAKPTNKALALTTDCNSRYVFADPYKGAMIAVAEAARNIVCSGGEPLGVTNCLNFGNPYDPEVYYQFTNAIKGMGEACVKFDTPVTGGNVSFYNQSPDGPVYPTPTIGMVGVLDSVKDKMTMDFKKEGDAIYLVGSSKNDINSSEYLHKLHGVEFSPAPYFDLNEEFVLQQAVLKLIRSKLVASAHDVSEGGLFITLTESCFNRDLGYSITTDGSIRKDAYLFGEAQSRVVVSVDATNTANVEATLTTAKVAFTKIGTVTKADIKIDNTSWGSIKDWKQKYDCAIENMLKGEVAEGALSTL
ncbi:MAG TPA: AIR synthase related protein, partial [Ferruginibacter sp.]|nr:AIR synthase related protein [Ferruginibacter sp.]